MLGLWSPQLSYHAHTGRMDYLIRRLQKTEHLFCLSNKCEETSTLLPPVTTICFEVLSFSMERKWKTQNFICSVFIMTCATDDQFPTRNKWKATPKLRTSNGKLLVLLTFPWAQDEVSFNKQSWSLILILMEQAGLESQMTISLWSSKEISVLSISELAKLQKEESCYPR